MDFSTQRQNMVDCQLRPNKISDKLLLDSFLSVPRERFVESSYYKIAYMDNHVPIGHNRKMLKPMVLARMLQELKLKTSDKVLILGAGTGYSSAIISPLVNKVYAIDNIRELQDIARKAMLDINSSNVSFICANNANGYPTHAPYDKILINIPLKRIPPELILQLKEGGKIAAVITPNNKIMKVGIFTRTEKILSANILGETHGYAPRSLASKQEFIF